MGRRHRKGRPVHGILLLDKPAGGSSNQVLQRVKRLFNAGKAGHTGSLDPLATGMLPICFGEATKLSGYLLDADKGYETTLQLGVTTDSADADGDVLQTRPVPSDLSLERLEEVCARFRGSQMQIPPMVSAIKIDGQRLYKLARQGIEVERPARAVQIHELCVLSLSGTTARLSVRCSKGTYIRSLVTDIGEALGCGAHVTQLRRTFVSPFEDHPMVDVAALEALVEAPEGVRDALLLPVDAGLLHMPAVDISMDGGRQFRQGQSALLELARPGSAAVAEPTLCRVYDNQGALVGLGEVSDSGEQVSPRRVLQWA